MSLVSSHDAKEQVRSATDIVDLVGQHVNLRREGRQYKGLCPWHDDSRPSLTIDPQRQTYRCWVCAIGGDVFSFVMKMENVEFPEALQMLAERAGIKLVRGGGGGGPSTSDRKRPLLEAMAWAEQRFHRFLLEAAEAEPARKYLASRQITPETIRQFHMGYAPNSWDWLLKQADTAGIDRQVLNQVNLVAPRREGNGYYDMFRGRVLFSIRDTQSRPVGFGGRILPELADERTPKYLNTSQTPLFHKAELLYNLDQARHEFGKTGAVMVMEGYTDCVIAQQCGFKNAVAVLGTALGPGHIKVLRRYGERIVLVLDGDEAGRKRTDELLELFLAEQVDLRILTLPGGLDPCDYLLQQGGDAFRALLAGAIDALEHKFRAAVSAVEAGGTGLYDTNRALEDTLATLAKAPRLSAATTSQMRLREEQILHRLSRQFAVPEERLRERLAALRRGGKRPASQNTAAAADQPLARPPAARRRELAERWLLEVLLAEPRCTAMARDALAAQRIADARYRAIFSHMIRLLEAGEAPQFDRLLLELDDPQLKALLVELDDESRAMQRSDVEAELQALLTVIQEAEAATQAAPPAMETSSPTSEGELSSLLKAIEQQRSRQGISLPTDG